METDKLLKFKLLRLLRQKQKLLNRTEVAKFEKLKAETVLLNASSVNDDDGVDKTPLPKDNTTQRLKDLNYSIEEIEKWEDKLLHKQKGFQNYEQLAEASFIKGSSKTGTDQELYNKQMEQRQEGMDFQTRVPKEKVNKVVKEYKELNERKIQKLNKRNKNKGVGSFINDKNREFNEKLDRHYGKYTKEVKESFERGTAL